MALFVLVSGYVC